MIVLDTHVWVWWLGAPGQLSTVAREHIERSMGLGKVHVSSISAWEVAMLVKKGRLELTMEVDDWIARSEALPFLKFVPVDNRIAVRSIELNDTLPDDPADRIIMATALSLGAALVTKDRKLSSYSGAETIW